MKKNLHSFVFPALLIPVFFAFFSCSSPTGSDSSGEAPRYRVIYAGNGNTGGTVPVDANSYAKGESVTVAQKPDTLVKAGYYFSSWDTSADATGVSYAPGSTCVMGDAALTLYAIWSTYAWTVTFDSQGAVSAASPTSCVVSYPATCVSSLPTVPTKSGFSFGGWWTGKSGAGTEFTASTTVSANVTVYAKWTEASSGGSGSGSISASVSIPGDGSITFSPSTLAVQKGNVLTVSVQETGYASYDWYIDGSGFSSGTSSIDIDTSLYASGTHELMLAVTDSEGTVSSGSLRFTIKN